MAGLALSFVAGALTLISPCVLPVLPIILSSALQEHRWGAVCMALGLTSSFTLLGLAIGALTPFAGPGEHAMRLLGATLLLIAGLILLIPRVEDRLLAPLLAHIERATGNWLSDKRFSGMAGQFALGATLGLVWSPCSGPFLGATLAMAATSGARGVATARMLCFGLGASLPMLIFAQLSRAAMARVRIGADDAWLPTKRTLGFVLMVLGFASLTGLDKRFESKMLDALPASWTDLITTL